MCLSNAYTITNVYLVPLNNKETLTRQRSVVSERDDDESLPEGLEEPLKAVKRKTSRQGYTTTIAKPCSTFLNAHFQ